jgi:hypothetical protein
MTARRVHAVLAAGVRNPDRIDAWRSDPVFLRAHGIEPAAIDLSALSKFTGFTTKVRHNGVRNLLPMSFRMMGVAGLEIDLFAAYASFCAARGYAYTGTTGERSRELVAFIERWLDFSRKDHVLLWDVIRHERALAVLAEPAAPAEPPAQADPAPDAPSSPPRVRGASVPRVCGRLVLEELQSDPRALVQALSQKSPAWDDVAPATRYYGYWRPERSSEGRIAELDAFGYYALSNVDGVRSAAELSRLLGAGAPTPNFLRSLTRLADEGLIRFDAAAAVTAP